MTLVGNLFEVRNANVESPEVPLTSETLLDFMGISKTAAGKNVNEVTALGMSAVWRAVTVSSNVPASLPFHPYVETGESRVRATGHPAKLMDEPHPDLPPYELWQTAYMHKRLWGNAYLRKLRNPLGQVMELWPIHPSRVKVGRTSETGVKVFSIDGGQQIFVGEDEILHLPGLGYDGICGVSPIRMAKQSIGFALAAEEYGAKLFGNGSLASGILQTEQRLTQRQADTLHKRWKERSSGMASAHETIVLDKGAKFTPLTIPPEDAQFLESRRFQITEVCRWFGIPPFLMFETEKSTSWGTGLEQQLIGWIAIDLRPELVGVEQRVSRILRPDPVYARYSLEGLLRGDSAARGAFYRTLWNLGALNSNEIRAYEELPPVEGGDTYYRPLNMGLLGTTDSAGQGPANPAPDPVTDPTKEENSHA